jgi:hypothetical protein
MAWNRLRCKGCVAGVAGYSPNGMEKNSVKARYSAGHSQTSLDSFALYYLTRSCCVQRAWWVISFP